MSTPGPVGDRPPSTCAWLVALTTLLAAATGCPPITPPDGGDDPPADELPFLDQDGNATFDSATALMLSPEDGLRFRGRIDGDNDLDLYDLGPLAAGDRLLVDVQRTSGDLDPVAAVFDDEQELHAYNDDRVPDGSNLNPLLDFVIRAAAPRFILGVSGFAGGGTSGEYRVTVQVTRGYGLPAPQPQIVFLNWNGGRNVTVDNVGTFNLQPFRAEDVGPYTGMTEAMKDRVQQIVQERYAGYALVVMNSDDHAVPDVPHSTIYFGGSNRQAFAISEQIDTLNQDPSDNSIIFTGSYVGAFTRTPTFEQISNALGNTAAHEVGHLLGLVHTADCRELMDTSCSNERILQVQTFGAAILDISVFPVGVQDAAEILGWILGTVGG